MSNVIAKTLEDFNRTAFNGKAKTFETPISEGNGIGFAGHSFVAWESFDEDGNPDGIDFKTSVEVTPGSDSDQSMLDSKRLWSELCNIAGNRFEETLDDWFRAANFDTAAIWDNRPIIVA